MARALPCKHKHFALKLIFHMNYKTLKNTTTNTLLQAFSDYFVPVKMTLDQLEKKLDSEHIRLDLSAEAFFGGKLVGFVLHGIDRLPQLQPFVKTRASVCRR